MFKVVAKAPFYRPN